ncbi:MAG: 3-phosphoglycerate dehydrogenase, partial [Clostridia bacterium]|nr:3-phosphoglycerate dehydrogenase [Clostridia bacterium]
NIVNSVNYPTCHAIRSSSVRICILHLNQKNMIAQFTTILADNHINIDNFINSSKGDFAYSLIDIPTITDSAIDALKNIDGIIKLRVIK